jgi:hypothetical protein
MRRLVVALLLLAPPAAFGQSLITISPQQCVWRAGDDPSWAAPSLDESRWKPFTAFSLSETQPHFWIRCDLDQSSLRNLDHPAVQIRVSAAYEVFLNGVSIARIGNLKSGNFSMSTIRVCSVPPPLANDPRVLALRVVQRYAARVTPEVRLGDEQALRNDRPVICSASCRVSSSNACPLSRLDWSVWSCSSSRCPAAPGPRPSSLA